MKTLIPTLALLGAALLTSGCGGEETTATPGASAATQRVQVSVNGLGYEPSRVQATAGQPITLVFTRTSDEGCGDKLVIASHEIERDLPLNEPVEVTLTPTEAGQIRFSCAMDMYDGAIVVN
ncbi:MAG: cupredoxin domain-containing protein [Myxococcales bacterium]|nr:cupredoxin domain-containing protein [Myxococcales bacterium]